MLGLQHEVLTYVVLLNADSLHFLHRGGFGQTAPPPTSKKERVTFLKVMRFFVMGRRFGLGFDTSYIYILNHNTRNERKKVP